MRRTLWLRLYGFLLLLQMVIPVSASGDGTVIYIQEDAGSVLRSLLHQMLTEGWRDIVSVAAAFLCTCTVIILAINHKKPRKQFVFQEITVDITVLKCYTQPCNRITVNRQRCGSHQYLGNLDRESCRRKGEAAEAIKAARARLLGCRIRSDVLSHFVERYHSKYKNNIYILYIRYMIKIHKDYK